MIDVSDLVCDPDLGAEPLTIKRRIQTVGDNGRATMSATTVDPAPMGIVLPQEDSPLVRGPDQQNLPRLLQVHTQFRLRSASKDPATGDQFQPDVIIWNGDDYVVNKVRDFSHFGVGFICADCSSMDLVDNAPS